MRSSTSFLQEKISLLHSFFTGQVLISLLGLAKLSLPKCNFARPSKVLVVLDGCLATFPCSVFIFFLVFKHIPKLTAKPGWSLALLSPSPFVGVGLLLTPSPHKLPVLSMDASHRPSQLGSEHMEVSGVPTLLKSRGLSF